VKHPLRLPAAALVLWLCASAAAAGTGTAAPAALLDASAVAKRLGAELYWDPLTETGSFERNGAELRFSLGSPIALFNGRQILRLDPPEDRGSGLSFSEAAVKAMEGRFGPLPEKGHFTVAAILIDPGHGGKDTGAVGEHVINGKKLRIAEKDLTLDISKRIYSALAARFPDKKILITRNGDTYPTLDDRVAMANQVKLADNEAIIYISIHANASFSKTAKGFEVWYLNPEYRRTLVGSDTKQKVGEDIAPILNVMLEEEFTTESILLARDIMDGLNSNIGSESPNRGIRAEEWFVVRNARMPSVLVETGFITNPEEAKLLSSGDYLRRLSDGIYTGIVKFVQYFESMKGPSAQ